ncbi:MAG TPA: DEAD/DEAH box helicase family protein [Mucilaginibacter sp.]|jgi:replicative superfamily II helicase
MIDFRKKLGSTEIPKKINPKDIYESLDRRSVAGPLRPAQEYILDKWFNDRLTDNDLIIKLHTGEGKTLIGLLVLQSKINSGNGPCLYVCPNKYLVEQTCLEAKKFGIPFCIIEHELPNDFLDGKKILITHVQKVFNGRTIFGLNNSSIEVKNIILDDSHACIDSLKQSFTIQIPKENTLYSELKTLFNEDIREQGEGSFLDIEHGDFETLLPIPYWSLIDKKSEVLEIISKHKDDDEIKFSWPIIKDDIENCQLYISGRIIEISPYYVPIHHFGSFQRATQRILMSATTQDDSFFIKGLGFSMDSVKKPLTNLIQRWSGEKMLLIPSLINEKLDRDFVIEQMAKPSKKNFGIAVLISSFQKAKYYEEQGAIVAKTDQIFKIVNNIKQRHFEKTVVFVNRYDGIDLPDEACRVLVIDSKPYFNSLNDKYEEMSRPSSDIINIKIAQKVEQGLGRSVRGEKDFSIILLIGTDLVKFVRSSKTNKYFSEQTRKQIEIGLEIANMAEAEVDKGEDPSKVLSSLMNQSIRRDEGWKEFYKEEMNKIGNDEGRPIIYEMLSLEREAEEYHFKGNPEKACEKMQKLIDNYCNDDLERGWYLQLLARYTYFINKTESNTLQKSAFEKNLQLLKPKEGISYKKLNFINENRLRRLKEWVVQFESFEELMLSLDHTLDNFSFGMPAEKFEVALQEIGSMLGFLSQRPDKEFKKGPDNLWCGVDDKYLIFECKSEVDDDREEISKYEAGQMNTHCAWFKKEYEDSLYKPILIIPTKTLSYHGDFTDEVEVMRKGKLRSLKNNVKAFFKEFKNYNIHEISDEKLNEMLNSNHLDVQNLSNAYSEKYFHKKSK